MASQLSYVDYTKAKLRSLCSEISKLQQSDFPEISIKGSLDKLETLIKTHISRLDSLPSQTIWSSTCQEVNIAIARLLPVLGFILRSTNVRNAFELHDPVLRLCKSFLGSDTRLILSSEWEFSPLTYASVVSSLPEYVFIGMPVSEAGNALIIPLVGHEIAHSVWRTKLPLVKLRNIIQEHVKEEIKNKADDFEKHFPNFKKDAFCNADDISFIEGISNVLTLSERQCEEEFCDFVACRIFGDSYLDAFEFLLAPRWGKRSPEYLDLPDRATALADTANEWGYATRTNYADSFTTHLTTESENIDDQEKLLIQVSDGTTKRMLPLLRELAKYICEEGSIPEWAMFRLNVEA